MAPSDPPFRLRRPGPALLAVALACLLVSVLAWFMGWPLFLCFLPLSFGLVWPASRPPPPEAPRTPTPPDLSDDDPRG